MQNTLTDAVAVTEAHACDILSRLALLREHRQARGMFPSEKMRKPASWTTLHQRDTMTLLELHHDVVSYETWPVEAHVRIGRMEFVYHPSLGLEMQNGRKIAFELLGERSCTVAQGMAIQGFLGQAVREHGYTFIMTRERTIAGDKCLAIARDVVRAAGWPVGEAAAFEMTRKLADLGGSSTVTKLTKGKVEALGTVCVLVMRRIFAIDLHEPLLDDCVVRLPKPRDAYVRERA